MMGTWMLYAAVVAALLSGAAWLAEAVARSHRLPTRWTWVVALLGSVALPLGVLVGPAPRQPTSAGAPLSTLSPGLGPSTDPTPGTAPLSAGASDLLDSGGALAGLVRAAHVVDRFADAVDPALLPAWIFLTLLVAAFLGMAALRLVRERTSWSEERVDGRDVWVSPALGPAVVGLLRARIVVPRWVLSLTEEDRALVLRHEEEHRRVGDPRLLAVALVLVVLLPWNPLLWWQVARLRLAVETDCDRRVLRARGDTRRYALLLVELARRGTRLVAPGALALAPPASSLERRIRTMTASGAPRLSRTFAGLLLSTVLAFGACAVRHPEPPIAAPGAPEDAPFSGARQPADTAGPDRLAGQGGRIDTLPVHVLMAHPVRIDSVRPDSVRIRRAPRPDTAGIDSLGLAPRQRVDGLDVELRSALEAARRARNVDVEAQREALVEARRAALTADSVRLREVARALSEARAALARSDSIRTREMGRLLAEARAAGARTDSLRTGDLQRALAEARTAMARGDSLRRGDVQRALAESRAALARSDRARREATRETMERAREAVERAHRLPTEEQLLRVRASLEEARAALERAERALRDGGGPQ